MLNIRLYQLTTSHIINGKYSLPVCCGHGCSLEPLAGADLGLKLGGGFFVGALVMPTLIDCTHFYHSTPSSLDTTVGTSMLLHAHCTWLKTAQLNFLWQQIHIIEF